MLLSIVLQSEDTLLREYEISQKWANFKKRPQILDKPMSGTLLSGKSLIRTQSVKKNPADELKNQIATNFVSIFRT